MSTDVPSSSPAPAGPSESRSGGVENQLLDAPSTGTNTVSGERIGEGLGVGPKGMPDVQRSRGSDDITSNVLLDDATTPIEPSGGLGEQPDTQQASDQLPQDVVDRAATYGFTPDDLAVFGGDLEGIDALLTSQEQLVLNQGLGTSFPPNQGMAPQGQQWVPQSQPMQNPGMSPQRPQQGQLPPALQPYQFDLDPMEYDEKLRQQLQAAANHQQAQLMALWQMTAQTAGTLQQQNAARMEEMRNIQGAHDQDQFHGWIGKLGDEFNVLFGKGDHHQVRQDSPQWRNRSAVFNRFQEIRNAYLSTGQKLPPTEAMFRSAAQHVLGNPYNYFEQRVKSNRTAGRRGQFLNRPTQRTGKPLSGREAAAQFADGFYRERGIETPRHRGDVNEQDQLL